MTKTIIAVLLMSVGMGTVEAQYDLKTAERERMAKARVKTQTEFTHDYRNGQPTEQGYKSSVRQFDTKGNLTEAVNYDAAGKVISVVVYQYDNKNRQVNYERYQGDREKLQYSQKIVYDAGDNKTREYGFDGVTSYSNVYIYDNNGKLAEIQYTSNQQPVEKRKLSVSGNTTDIQIYDAGNRLLFKQVNTYNAKGHLLSEIKTDNTGKPVHSLFLTYKDDILLLSETKKRGDVAEYEKFYRYDEQNRPIGEETVNLGGMRYVSHEYQYNVDFLKVESWKKNQQSKEFSRKKIDYDDKGVYREIESYFATYKLYSLYKYTYEYY
ncbi:MAG: hypothetical protein LBF89_08675 [Bacteroidales bacterium]|jgi:hypothetical protein|nr:hypothetical protein [Bacteroidales bacterium]